MVAATAGVAQLQERIRAYLPGVELTHGVGTDAQHACTIAAINLALSDRLTDETPDCADEALCRWVIPVQDAMPAEMLEAGDEHGDRWRALIPCIAGTRDDGREEARRELFLAWMWDRLGDEAVVAAVPLAARPAWETMLRERTVGAAKSAATAAKSATAAAYAANLAAYTAAYTAAAADLAAYAAKSAATTANLAAYTAAYTAADAAVAAYWRRADPAGLLLRLVTCGEQP